jgi:outer membrane protein TolC
MTWKIFDAGKIRANVRARNAMQEQALAAYEETALTAFEDVENPGRLRQGADAPPIVG